MQRVVQRNSESSDREALDFTLCIFFLYLFSDWFKRSIVGEFLFVCIAVANGNERSDIGE